MATKESGWFWGWVGEKDNFHHMSSITSEFWTFACITYLKIIFKNYLSVPCDAQNAFLPIFRLENSEDSVKVLKLFLITTYTFPRQIYRSSSTLPQCAVQRSAVVLRVLYRTLSIYPPKEQHLHPSLPSCP